MTKYRIIGNMTGNSMDAIDLVLTEFDGDIMRDICTYTKPYSKDMQNKVESLRAKVFNKTSAEIETLPEFTSVHDEYIRQIAECINEMCEKYDIDKNNIEFVASNKIQEAPVTINAFTFKYADNEIAFQNENQAKESLEYSGRMLCSSHHTKCQLCKDELKPDPGV